MSPRYYTDPVYRAKVDAVAAKIPPLTEERKRIVRGLIAAGRREAAQLAAQAAANTNQEVAS